MSNNVVVSEEALRSLVEALKTYILRCHTAFSDSYSRISSDTDNWHDSDKDELLSVIKDMAKDVDAVERCTDQILFRIKEKLDMIAQLRGMGI